MSRRLLEKNFCAIPWTGFELEPNGDIKNCIISKDVIGNIHKQDLKTIINSNPVRRQMLKGEYPETCSGCYLQEKHRKQNFDSISSRIYYTKHLANKLSPNLLENADNFELRHVDLRWSNSCNQACTYCGPLYSSKWVQELGRKQHKDKSGIAKLKKFVFENIENLENVYMAGGEPMLMKENKEFLDLLYKKNPNVTLRINTNLSKTNTGIFDTVCKFKNVHWTVSVEAIEEEYNYVRHHGNWDDFLENFKIIQKLPHKISINGLYFILNYKSIFDTVKFFQNMGVHNNSFVIGPLYKPLWLNILNLPETILQDCKRKFENEVSKKPGFLLQNSYENIISYLTDTKFYANIELTKQELKNMDLRRNIASTKVFPNLYKEVLN